MEVAQVGPIVADGGIRITTSALFRKEREEKTHVQGHLDDIRRDLIS